MPLTDPALGERAGAAFSLLAPARESQRVGVDGWQVEVVARFPSVIVRGGTETSYEDALEASLRKAQRGLDLLSMGGANNLVVKGVDEDHLVWWPSETGLTIRAVSLAPISIDVPPVTVTVHDAQGTQVITPPPPPPLWHESFRYFRLSQTSADLFDAYRNAYLALESVLSSIAPQQTNTHGKVIEAEGDWFKRALSVADSIVPLASIAPRGTKDPLQHLFNELYVSMRSAMSHAKSGRVILLPQDESERTAVSESLGRLASFYLKLAEAHLGARRAGGGMFAGGFKLMFRGALDKQATWVSSDESPFDPSSPPALDPRTMRQLTPIGATDSPRPFVLSRLWATSTDSLSELPFVRCAIGYSEDQAISHAMLDGRLELGSATTLEVALGFRGINARQLETRYSY